MSDFFKTWTLQSITSLAMVVNLHPSFGYKEEILSQREVQESQSGKVAQYKLDGGFFNFDLPLDLVTSSDAFYIRQFWQNQSEVRFTQTTSGNIEFVDCRIINQNDPFSKFSDGQCDRFDGTLQMVSINNMNTSRGIVKNKI